MVKKYMRRCSVSLVTGEIRISESGNIPSARTAVITKKGNRRCLDLNLDGEKLGGVWWLMPITPAPGRRRQGGQFRSSPAP